MYRTRKSARFGALAAAASLTFFAAACGDDDTDSGSTGGGSGTAAPSGDTMTDETMMTEDTMSEGTMSEGTMAEGAMEPSGPACGSVPTEGEGSFEGMADDPAATAASNNPELSTLVEAVGAAELGDTLNGEGPFTIFAPANVAFEAVPPADLEALLADKQMLTDVLTYHVIPEQLSSTQLIEQGSVESVQGGMVEVAMDGDMVALNGDQATVVCADVPVGNGTVHIIDGVLMPQG